jgi:type II secretory ATPase GspE/PulE/Tfp pilus assembly ATPase PilB-like protein/small nuclear ribonucleoprotein (snRNP)-like protein
MGQRRYSVSAPDKPEQYNNRDVMIHLMNGEVLEGYLSAFSPIMTELHLHEAEIKENQPPKSLDIKDIAYIFMHDAPELVPNQPPKIKKMDELIISTVTSKRYKVLAFPPATNTPGFYSAVSKDEELSFERIFFYFHGIRYQEKPERLGDLMVDQEMLSVDDVQLALETQSKLMIPLGDILKENGKVNDTDIDKALTTQKRQQMKFGDLLVDQELISEKDVKQALESQTESKDKALGLILLEHGKVKDADIDKTLTIQSRFRMKLGELLIEAGLITDEDLQYALEAQKERGQRLGEILLNSGIITEDQLLTALANKFRLPTIDLDQYNVDPLASSEISREVIERYRILPIQTDKHTLTIALADPLGLEAYDTVCFTTGKKVHEVLVKSSQLDVHLDRYLKNETQEEELSCEFLHQDDEDIDEPVNEFEMAQSAEDAPIVRLVNRIIRNGLRKKASDIHILPQAKKIILAYRLNGDLIVENALDKSLHKQIAARIKILSGMDIAEQRMPQDGRLLLRDGKNVFEFRISCIPNSFGESLVLRVLSKEVAADLDTLGLRGSDLKQISMMARKPYGLLLVVGPTGSGKSTTLFAILKSVSHLPEHILTIEDPVESDIDGANQIQVNKKIGLTFARVLRNVLRHDPDIIMIGEMRDKETAEVGIEAALTGHLMLSTLHTNSAVDTIIRLNDLGIPNYLLAPALLGVISQNLVKQLCSHCRQKLPENHETFTIIKGFGYEQPAKLYKAGSCGHCNQTGYIGRVMLYELLTVDDHVRNAIHDGRSGDQLQQTAIEHGMVPKARLALQMAADGVLAHNDLIRALM